MCTSIAMNTQNFYFGRTMDLHVELEQRIVLTPRNYPIRFRRAGTANRHYAVLGMATVIDGYPLYADGVNEKGLCIAALNFPDNAYYPPEEKPGNLHVSPFEFCLWLLSKCATVSEAREYLKITRLVAIPFSSAVPLTPLHWHIGDKNESIVLESTRDGLKLYDNPVGVLTNNPSFDFQMTNLSQYLNLTTRCPDNCFSKAARIRPFGQGLGSFGLPGDFSPASRFVKAAYLTLNSVCEGSEESSVAQLFHLLDSVALVKGSVITGNDQCDVTTYSCCINGEKQFYYYKTYFNNQLTAIDMKRENLDQSELTVFPFITQQQTAWINA